MFWRREIAIGITRYIFLAEKAKNDVASPKSPLDNR